MSVNITTILKTELAVQKPVTRKKPTNYLYGAEHYLRGH
jgi:hypothetical protein